MIREQEDERRDEARLSRAQKGFKSIFKTTLSAEETEQIAELASADHKSLLKVTIAYCILQGRKQEREVERIKYLSMAVQGMKAIVVADAKRQENSMAVWFAKEHGLTRPEEGANPTLDKYAPPPAEMPGSEAIN